MIFGRSDKPEHHRVYIDNIVIERVNCNTFLGVFTCVTIISAIAAKYGGILTRLEYSLKGLIRLNPNIIYIYRGLVDI